LLPVELSSGGRAKSARLCLRAAGRHFPSRIKQFAQRPEALARRARPVDCDLAINASLKQFAARHHPRMDINGAVAKRPPELRLFPRLIFFVTAETPVQTD
jgi:hypothetical protein